MKHECEEMKKFYSLGIEIFKLDDVWVMETDTNEGYTDVTEIKFCPWCGKELDNE